MSEEPYLLDSESYDLITPTTSADVDPEDPSPSPSHSSLPTAPSANANMSTVNINGVDVALVATKRQVTNEQVALYTKADRDKLSADKLNDLFEKAVAKSQTKYDLLDLKLDDPDKLEDTYNLEMAVDATRAHHVKYDMSDVFTIVVPDMDPARYQTKDLYKDYSTITIQEVLNSNEWYATMTADPLNHYFLQNLKLTHEHLKNNAEDRLVTKVNELYSAYPKEQQGGPLFFKLMMDTLQDNSEESSKYLVATVKNLKLTDFDGESVPIDEAIAKLSESELDLEVEDSVAGFLGVHIERNEMDGSIISGGAECKALSPPEAPTL